MVIDTCVVSYSIIVCKYICMAGLSINGTDQASLDVRFCIKTVLTMHQAVMEICDLTAHA